MLQSSKWGPLCTALAVFALGSGCALRPVFRGQVASYSVEQSDFDEGGGGGGVAEAPILLAARQPLGATTNPAKAEPAAPEQRVAQRAEVVSAPTSNRVAVTIRAKDEQRHYEVVAGAGQKCAVPCTLELAPGMNLLSFEGDARTATWVNVPARGGTVEVKLGTPGARVAAWVLGGSGTLIIAIGAALTPVLGPLPLFIMAGVGLALLIPGIIVGAANGDSAVWLPEPSR